MTETRFVILWRNTQNNRISFVSDGDDEMAVFASYVEADEAARHTTVCKAFPYQIVEVEA